jgi:hypothetical protein
MSLAFEIISLRYGSRMRPFPENLEELPSDTMDVFGDLPAAVLKLNVDVNLPDDGLQFRFAL